eukprot:GHUV01056866.1.p1 GENE.GHUV01056866.1~~GHUV01056866.1.p1  ORF type:complete len:189 (+),score=11.30 GHUV01056866.1:770-1336(+)
MATWILGFAGTAFIIVPYFYTRAVGQPLWELGPSGQADFALWSEIVESVVTFAILGVVAARFPTEVKQQQLFNFSLSQPFKRGQGWLAWAMIGVAAAPLVVGATAAAVTAVGYEQATSNTHGTVDGVAGMLSLDWPTYVRLLSVTGMDAVNKGQVMLEATTPVELCHSAEVACRLTMPCSKSPCPTSD